MKIMSLGTPVGRLNTPKRSLASFESPSVSLPVSPRFGALCPICMTLLAGGIGAGIAMLRKMSGDKDNRYSLQKLYGETLGNQLLAKLEQLETQKPGVIKTFMANPEAGSASLMKELGEDFTGQLQAALEAHRNKTNK